MMMGKLIHGVALGSALLALPQGVQERWSALATSVLWELVTTPDPACAGCWDELVNGGNQSRAEWRLNGSQCSGGSSCAECVPTCSAYGGSGSVPYAEALAYYNANSCAAWQCGGGEYPEEQGGDLEAALELPLDAQVAALTQAIGGNVATLRLNAERRAIQIYGCADQVIAQYDLTPQVVDALSSALAQLY